MVQERKDRLLAYRVEKGLFVQKTISTKAAAAYLANHGVPMHVSVRILTTDNKREMGELEQAPFWFDIIRAAGPTFGAKVDLT